MRGHLKARTLQALPSASFELSQRARLVGHLSTGCPRCWRRVERLVRAHPMPSPNAPDPLALALWRRPPADHLRPAHRLAAQQARTSPTGFARLVLEEARGLALRAPHQGEQWLSQARELLAAARLETLDPTRARDLEALGWIYLGDVRGLLRRHLEAETCFETARGILARGSGSAEIAATFETLCAQLRRAQGDVRGSLELLGRAERLLQEPGLEGRRAEVLGRRGALLQWLGNGSDALAVFQETLALLPAGQSLQLRLWLLHEGAAAAQRLDLPELATVFLDEAEPILQRYDPPQMRAQHFWQRGRVQITGERFEAADESLQTALRQFLELGNASDATRVLFDLGQLYSIAGWHERFRLLEDIFDQMRNYPTYQEVLLSLLIDVAKLARRKGVETPCLEELLQWIEARKPPTH